MFSVKGILTIALRFLIALEVNFLLPAIISTEESKPEGSGFFVIYLKVPPIAFDPYKVP